MQSCHSVGAMRLVPRCPAMRPMRSVRSAAICPNPTLGTRVTGMRHLLWGPTRRVAIGSDSPWIRTVLPFQEKVANSLGMPQS